MKDPKDLIESEQSTEEIVNSLTEEIYTKSHYTSGDSVTQDMMKSGVSSRAIDRILQYVENHPEESSNELANTLMSKFVHEMPPMVDVSDLQDWIRGWKDATM